MQYGVFLFFGGCMASMTAYIACCLPETKGIMVENIMSVWARCAGPTPPVVISFMILHRCAHRACACMAATLSVCRPAGAHHASRWPEERS